MRASRQVALVVAPCVAVMSANAANPYRPKQHIAQLPADVGMDAARLHDTRQACCGLLDPTLAMQYSALNQTVFHACLAIEIDEGFAFFAYDDKAKMWKNERVLRPDNVSGARGDNKRPIERIRLIEQLGFKPIEGVASIAQKLEEEPINIRR